MNLVMMHHTNPVAWVFMPQLIKRAREFADGQELDFNADLIEESIRIHFVARDPLVMSWVLVDGSIVKGHIIVTIDSLVDFFGNVSRRYLTILQAETSKPVPQMMDIVKEWARDHGCEKVQLLASGAARVRLFKKYGFREHRTLMQLKLED